MIVPFGTVRVIVHSNNSNCSLGPGTAWIRTAVLARMRVATNEPAGYNAIDSPSWPAYHDNSFLNQLSRGVHSGASLPPTHDAASCQTGFLGRARLDPHS